DATGTAPGSGHHNGRPDSLRDGEPTVPPEVRELAGTGPVVPELGLPAPGLAELDSGEEWPRLAKLRREAAGEVVEEPADPDPGSNGTAFGLLAELPAVTRPVRPPAGPVPALPQ